MTVSHRNSIRRTAYAIVLCLLSAFLVGVTASPAAAATPRCTAGKWIGVAFDSPPTRLFAPADSRGLVLNCILRRGDFNNWGVVALQNALIKCYRKAIARDGDYGSATETAVRQVQKAENEANGRNLTVDGIAGPQTLAHMAWPIYHRDGNLDASYACRRFV